MRSPRLRFLPALLILGLGAGVTRPASAAVCNPAACTAGLHKYIDFESIPTGQSVEGLGAVHPDLNIASVPWGFGPSCATGTAAVIEENVTTPFVSYSAGGSIPNGCLNGLKGFGDSAGCVLDYQFTFGPGVVVSCFSLRILDFGDLQPGGGSTHQVFLTGYDIGNNIVDQQSLLMTGGVDLIAGDACTSQAGDPGNFILGVSGPGIVKVTLTFDSSPDPNVGFDDIAFCETLLTTKAATHTWGEVKQRYR